MLPVSPCRDSGAAASAERYSASVDTQPRPVAKRLSGGQMYLQLPSRIAVRARAILTCALALSALTLCANAEALSISGTPIASIFAGKAYAFTPTVSGTNGHALVFSIANKPAWATFSTSTGRLSGTPSSTAAGWTYNIVITVSDGAARASTPRFDIVVRYDKVPPTITGSPPASVAAGSSYHFQPVGKDAAGNPLYYTIVNKPDWASFSVASGLLSGTPSKTETGTYSGIVIRTTDGNEAASLAPFSITVQPAAATATGGAATVSWVPPMDNTNGTAITNLAGYTIHYGTSPANLTSLIEVAGATVTNYTVQNLAAATWYFAITAYNSSGEASALSAVVSKTIP